DPLGTPDSIGALALPRCERAARILSAALSADSKTGTRALALWLKIVRDPHFLERGRLHPDCHRGVGRRFGPCGDRLHRTIDTPESPLEICRCWHAPLRGGWPIRTEIVRRGGRVCYPSCLTLRTPPRDDPLYGARVRLRRWLGGIGGGL